MRVQSQQNVRPKAMPVGLQRLRNGDDFTRTTNDFTNSLCEIYLDIDPCDPNNKFDTRKDIGRGDAPFNQCEQLQIRACTCDPPELSENFRLSVTARDAVRMAV